MIDLKALFLIVNEGQARKISIYTNKLGLQGATIMNAQGSLPGRILNFLGLERVNKEILLLVLTKTQHEQIYPKLCKKYCLDHANRGISFTLDIDYHLGIKRLPKEEIMENKSLSEKPHLIVTIVDRGNAHTVIDAANNAGARGATIIHGRGSGIEESEAFFHLNIQPEKDIILIVTPSERVVEICQAISNEAKLQEDGKGILFTLPIVDSAGIIALQS